MPTLDDLRTEHEAKLEKILAKLDERHKAQLRAAIKQYGANVPDSVWQAIQRDMEDEEVAAAILLLMMVGDDWTTGEIKGQGVAANKYSRREQMAYAFEAQRRTQRLAAQSVSTLRGRVTRKIQDKILGGGLPSAAQIDADIERAARGKQGVRSPLSANDAPSPIGRINEGDIDKALDDVFTQSRREAIATDQTTSGFSLGQRNAAERAGGAKPITPQGGDGNDAPKIGKFTIALIWHTERDNLVCPRCAPLDEQPEEVWGLVFPEGPGPDAHPNCRCSLEPRVVPVAEDSN